ncbi:MAG: LacI family DNA-binding transcriptional regulator [Xanthomonadales bacterium]|uniref:LacI family DNA-binding transcriptional regulator n=1 Tax=Hydrogenophaga sp. TaxID=1904254 RepID=UPI00261B26D4|nr:LacI family DNA-binding transcriptional regulator [Hydrogenophaga sp.]MCK9490389.1 LacI family DNA-binding transcriptional regulator [Xanthomonadales bacterium]MDD3786633.1 LacI family DNA-binding transcriptional regulator [Hydrogenophaga sp.]
MSKPARIPDIAHLAGVSTATVDRVLNRRPGVRRATVERVLQAAERLQYLPDADVRAALQPAPMQLVFLLPAGSNRFLRMLGDTIGYSEAHWAPYNVRCRVEWIEGFNPEALARALLRHGARADGIAFMALEHPLVRDAVDALAERGVPTVTLISDISNTRRAAYVGLDNRSAGRTAAYLIARFIGERPAQVAMIAGSLSYRAHEEREMGFLYLFKESFPHIEVVGLREGHDDAERNYALTRTLLEQFPDLAGIYNIGGASDGVGRALKEAGRDQKVVFIGHGLSPDTRALLIEGTMDAVISQNPQGAMMTCVRIFSNLRDGRDALTGVDAVRGQIIFRENLP